MTTLPDLQLCTYPPLAPGNLLAIGWLDRDVEYPKGAVSDEFFEKLDSLCKAPWQPAVSAGMHQCNLCQFDGPRFGSNVYVPGNGNLYFAPAAVAHYVAVHWYLPPREFIEAVLACPPMRSVQYYKALLANGGRAILKPPPE